MSLLAMSLLLPVLSALLPACNAHGSSSTAADGSLMMAALHFTPLADTLWFAGWTPSTSGALAGVCIGLFLLAIVDRFVAAVRPIMEMHWRADAEKARRARGGDSDGSIKGNRRPPRAPAFAPAHDLVRGAMYTLQAFLGFAIMLVVMTFQAAFIISLVVGLGVVSDVAVPEFMDPLVLSRPPYTYVEEAKWQIYFTIVWSSFLGICIFLALPRLVRGLRTGRTTCGLRGVRLASGYTQLPADDGNAAKFNGNTGVLLPFEKRHFNDPPRHEPQPRSDYRLNRRESTSVLQPTSAGFLALAQLLPVFLFGTKNSVVTLLLGPGVDYTKLNFLHRWAGRGLTLGALWIQNHLVWNLPILSRQKEASGVAAMAGVCIIVLSSVAPVRRWSYSVFLIVHFLTFPAFFITAWYHTIYASPWIFPPIAFSAFDVVLRLFKYRVVVGAMKPVDEMMTSTRPRDGPRASLAQHVQVRVLFGGRAWEAHPLSVLCAAPDTTCLSHRQGSGCCARAAMEPFTFGCASEATVRTRRRQATREPIGEMPYDSRWHTAVRTGFGEYEACCSSPAAVGRRSHSDVRRPRGRCVRRGRAGESVQGESSGHSAIAWFAPRLLQMAQMAQRSDSALELKIRIYVTRLCNTYAVLPIPGCDVTVGRPSVAAVLNDIVFDSSSSSPEYRSSSDSAASSTEAVLLREKGVNSDAEGQRTRQGAGGIAVIASGPASLIREASNVVARANLVGRGGALAGGIDGCLLFRTSPLERSSSRAPNTDE
ncbi:Ctr copper transporter family-domain-containing protein [Mycena sp. CBHHK59/15]|nr:Ctr copper transporter family-domain-containing protein [Mycena sp. CBHHK59/15]